MATLPLKEIEKKMSYVNSLITVIRGLDPDYYGMHLDDLYDLAEDLSIEAKEGIAALIVQKPEKGKRSLLKAE